MFDEFKQSRIPFKKYSLESGYANTFKSETVKTVLSSTPAQDQDIFQSVERRGDDERQRSEVCGRRIQGVHKLSTTCIPLRSNGS